MSYWTPRADAPIRTCPGGKCERKTDCRRFIERTQHFGGEVFPLAPHKDERVMEDGLPRWKQVCDHYLARTAA